MPIAHVESPRPAAPATDNDMSRKALEWLAGRLLPHLTGSRVLLYTYNNSGYLGVREASPEGSGGFIRRYEFQGHGIHVSDMQHLPEDPNVIEGIHALGTVIQQLQAAGKIIQLPTPRQYEGAAVIYGLPH